MADTLLKTLTGLGWTCLTCGCPGKKGHDCVNKFHRGILIEERVDWFRILKQGRVIASTNAYNFNETMKEHGLIQE